MPGPGRLSSKSASVFPSFPCPPISHISLFKRPRKCAAESLSTAEIACEDTGSSHFKRGPEPVPGACPGSLSPEPGEAREASGWKQKHRLRTQVPRGGCSRTCATGLGVERGSTSFQKGKSPCLRDQGAATLAHSLSTSLGPGALRFLCLHFRRPPVRGSFVAADLGHREAPTPRPTGTLPKPVVLQAWRTGQGALPLPTRCLARMDGCAPGWKTDPASPPACGIPSCQGPAQGQHRPSSPAGLGGVSTPAEKHEGRDPPASPAALSSPGENLTTDLLFMKLMQSRGCRHMGGSGRALGRGVWPHRNPFHWLHREKLPSPRCPAGRQALTQGPRSQVPVSLPCLVLLGNRNRESCRRREELPGASISVGQGGQ